MPVRKHHPSTIAESFVSVATNHSYSLSDKYGDAPIGDVGTLLKNPHLPRKLSAITAASGFFVPGVPDLSPS